MVNRKRSEGRTEVYTSQTSTRSWHARSCHRGSHGAPPFKPGIQFWQQLIIILPWNSLIASEHRQVSRTYSIRISCFVKLHLNLLPDWVWWCTPLISTLGRQTDLSELFLVHATIMLKIWGLSWWHIANVWSLTELETSWQNQKLFSKWWSRQHSALLPQAPAASVSCCFWAAGNPFSVLPWCSSFLCHPLAVGRAYKLQQVSGGKVIGDL